MTVEGVGRGEAMVAHRRLDSQVKRERVAAATQARLAAGDVLTIAAIARHAGVSRKFIYAHPDLRAQIEHRALQATTRSTSATVADSRVTVASLRTSRTPRLTTIAWASRSARSSSASR